MPLITERIVKKTKYEKLPKDRLEFIFMDGPYGGPQGLRGKEDIVSMLASYYTQYVKHFAMREAEDRGARDVKFGNWQREYTRDMKKKVYDTEWSVEAGRRDFSAKNKLTIGEARKLVAEVLKSGLWKQARRNAPKPGKKRQKSVVVDINNRFKQWAGMSYGGRIELSPRHIDKFTVLHEMAHEAGYGGHGRGFRLMQVLLLAKFGDLSVARKLHRAYVAKGMPVALSDIPPITPWATWVGEQIKAWYRSAKRSSGVGGKWNGIYVDGKWKSIDDALEKLLKWKLAAGLSEARKSKILSDTRAQIFDGPDGKIGMKILWEPAPQPKIKKEKSEEAPKQEVPQGGHPMLPVVPGKRIPKAKFLMMVKTMLGDKPKKKAIMAAFGISSPTLQKVLREDGDLPTNTTSKVVNSWNEWVQTKLGHKHRIVPPGTKISRDQFTRMGVAMLGEDRRPKDIISAFGISHATLLKISRTREIGTAAGNKIASAWNKWLASGAKPIRHPQPTLG